MHFLVVSLGSSMQMGLATKRQVKQLIAGHVSRTLYLDTPPCASHREREREWRERKTGQKTRPFWHFNQDKPLKQTVGIRFSLHSWGSSVLPASWLHLCCSVALLYNYSRTNREALSRIWWLNPLICFNKVFIVIAGTEDAQLHTVASWHSVAV